MEPRLRKSLALNLLLALTAILVAAGLGEVGLRLLKPRPVMIQRQPAIYLRDEVLGSRYAPDAAGLMHRCFEIDNVVRTNSLGFHDVEHEMAPGALHVAAIGDSFTAAFEVSRTQGWTQLLQQHLRAADYSGAEVVNLGQDHSGTDIHLELLRRYLESHRPDMVVLAFYENDIEDIARSGFFRETVENHYVMVYATEEQRQRILERIRAEAPGPAMVWLCDHFYTCRLLRAFFTGEDDLYFNNIVGIKGGGRPGTAGNHGPGPLLDQLLELSRDHGFMVAVAPVPPLLSPRGSVWRLRNSIGIERFRKLNVINVFPVMERILGEDGRSFEEMYWTLDAHFNEYGNKVFARVVFEAMQKRMSTRSLP
jgi:hypothetical protein